MPRLCKLLICTIICMLVFSSCKQEAIKSNPKYNIFPSSEPTNFNPTPSDIIDNETVNDTNNEIQPNSSTSLQDEPWPYPLDFEGITPSGTNRSGNLSINFNRIDTPFSNMICPDSENDILYYVNYGADHYIYQLSGGVSSLLLKKEAFSLNLWENKLYFLCKNENSDVYILGDIYCYDLDTEELRLIQTANARYLIVDSLGIYYEEKVDLDPNSIEFAFYRFDHSGENLKVLVNQYLQSYYDYQLVINETGVVLLHNETQEEIFVAPLYYSYALIIYNDCVFFNRESVFYSLNLLNGEKKAIRWDDKENNVFPVDYIIIDNAVYLQQVQIDLVNGLIYKHSVSVPDSKEAFHTSYLFTDGNQIYGAATYPFLGNYQKLVKLEYGYDDANSKFVIKAKELGE